MTDKNSNANVASRGEIVRCIVSRRSARESWHWYGVTRDGGRDRYKVCSTMLLCECASHLHMPRSTNVVEQSVVRNIIQLIRWPSTCYPFPCHSGPMCVTGSNGGSVACQHMSQKKCSQNATGMQRELECNWVLVEVQRECRGMRREWIR